MRRIVLPTSSAFLVVAYFLTSTCWFHRSRPAAAATVEARAELNEGDDGYDTDAAWRYRRAQVKHWRMLVINR